jgi:hypothetical protein
MKVPFINRIQSLLVIISFALISLVAIAEIAAPLLINVQNTEVCSEQENECKEEAEIKFFLPSKTILPKRTPLDARKVKVNSFFEPKRITPILFLKTKRVISYRSLLI